MRLLFQKEGDAMAFEVPHKHDISLDGQDMRNQMIENFEAIEKAINDFDKRITKLEKLTSDLQKQLNSSDINTEYITDTGVPSNAYDEAPTSIDIDDTVEADNDGLRILESKD